MKRYNYEIIIWNIDILDTVETYCQIFNINYCYILHDHDKFENGEDKKAHVHFLIFFPYQKTLSAVSKLLGVPPNMIQYVDNKVGAIRYLTHIDNEDKYKYNIDSIVSNFDVQPYFQVKKQDKSSEEGIQVLSLIEYIRQNEYTTLEMLVQYAIDNGIYSTLRRNQNILMKLLYGRR